MAYGLTRRSLLRGLGTAALALPVLELTRSKGSAANGRPNRFVLLYAGISTSTDRAPGQVLLRPERTGTGYDLPRSLTPLGSGTTAWGQPGYDVQDEVSVVTGLTIPWGADGAIPPGGKSVHFHYNTAEQQTTGMRRGDNRGSGPAASSADVIAADALGETTQGHLSYRVQAARYISGSNSSGGGLDALSLRRRADGSLQSIDATTSPRLAYRSLFSGFVPMDEGREEALRRLRQRRDILAAVRPRTSSLIPRLGMSDQRRIQQHLEELNRLEGRLAMMPEPGMGACVVPTDPGEDPPIADGHNTLENGNVDYTPSRAWSEETLRGETMIDMVRMALTCDLARSVGFRIPLDQTFLNAQQAVGVANDMHNTTHSGTADDCSDALAWHVSFFARLVAGLRDTEEVDGSSLLDHTTVVLLFEGGHGHDPEGVQDNRAHSTENMSALIAGRVGGLQGGRHIATDRAHPARVVASALSAVGLGDSLGEISGRLDGLF